MTVQLEVPRQENIYIFGDVEVPGQKQFPGSVNVVEALAAAGGFKDTADLAPSKEKYRAFLEKWGEDRQEETRTIAKDYPAMRQITGQYQVRELTFKDVSPKQTDTPPGE